MALEGTIKDFALADILQLIGIQRKTGILALDNGEDVVTITFLDGQVVGADTRLRNLEDFLGTVLVRTGRITQARLDQALDQQRSTLQRLGYILVKGGAISEDDLREALRIQVAQIVYRLFRWRDGRYHFTPSDRVEYDKEHFSPISSETIVMEGARMIDEWPIIERRIKSPTTVYRKTPSGSALAVPVAPVEDDDLEFDFGFDRPANESGEGEANRVKVSREESDILRLVDGKISVQGIVDRSTLSEFDAYRTLYDLLVRNLIEEVPAEPVVLQGTEPLRQSRFPSVLAHVLVFLLAAFAVATGASSPVAPWHLSGASSDATELKTLTSHRRLERIRRALEVFYLERGAMPGDIRALVGARYLDPNDLLDPWGRPYVYRASPSGYEIAGGNGGGEPDPRLTVRRTFGAAQRLLLDGQAPAQTD